MELLPKGHEWHDIFLPGLSLFEKVFRPVVVYLGLLILFRLTGKKQLGQMSLFDFIIVLLVSETAQNALIGEEFSITGGLLAAGILVGMSQIFDKISFKSPKVGTVLEGKATLLIYEGQIIERNVTKETVSREEILSILRQKGIASIKEVRFAVLETEGTVSVIKDDAPRPKDGSDDDTMTKEIRGQAAQLKEQT